MVVQVFFRFGDVAGKGFGSTLAVTYDFHSKFSYLMDQDNGLNYMVGFWMALIELVR